MKLSLFIFLLTSFSLFSQTTIKGTVLTQNGKPVELATVFIKGTMDAVQTDADGKFTLVSKLTGKQLLVIRSEEIEEKTQEVTLSGGELVQEIRVDKSTKIEDVVIVAGSMQANNDRAVAILNPIDIVTTAGGHGDIAGALQTLPGVQRNGGDQTGLMVRGGDVNESLVVIDGLVA
ncbi:MAG: carboxypeptidase-like regulatory domain-containing protein, partial [Fluviicola sp.]|nr:carboxypeptidase-like regulatory domain-containing protein [Fluviicola sp.]